MSRPVLLTPRTTHGAADPRLAEAAADASAVVDGGAGDRLDGWLGFAADWGERLPLPGAGETRLRWELLATVGAADLGVARVLEPHVDALAILAEAPDGSDGSGGSGVPGATWGVFAAEGGPARLTATRAGARWSLSGVKPWCSLAGRVSHALVTAWVDGEPGAPRRGLFAVDLEAGRDSGAVEVGEVTWAARGLREIVSGPITCRDAPASAVGGPGWYLERPGFAWGGIGVAAVWYGGAVAVARRLRRVGPREPDQLALAHLGAVDEALAGARAVLAEAATLVDAGSADGLVGGPELLTQRVRGVVAEAVDRVLQHAAHALGPGPLTQEEEHARRVADLTVYVRQHHAERDRAAVGRMLLELDADGDDDGAENG